MACRFVGKIGKHWILGKDRGVIANRGKGIGACEIDFLKGPHCRAGEIEKQISKGIREGRNAEGTQTGLSGDTAPPELFYALSVLQLE